MVLPAARLFEFIKREGVELFSGAHAVYTPQPLVEEILSQIDVKNKTILVLFNVEFVISLVHTYKVDPAMITLYVDHENKAKLAQRMGVNFITSLDVDMKFDVVVGNPPYQASGTQGKKLWKEFFIKFHKLTKKDGCMAILTPSSYVKRSGQRMEKVRALVEQNTVRYLDMDATNYFNVGEDICAIVIEEGKKFVKTKVKFGNKIELQDLSNTFSPSFGNIDILIKSILHKVQASSFPKLQLKEDINNSQAKLVEEKILSVTKNSIYKYPVIYTPNTTHFAKELFGDKNHLKLIITIAGTYYNEKTPNRNIFITDVHSGQGMCHILISTTQEGECIKSYMTSKLYRFYIDTEKTSGYNTGLKHLPDLGRSKVWTDAEIYQHFGLTQEEIDYVEANVK